MTSAWATESRRSDVTTEVHNGSVLIPVFINGKQFSFLVDTGSTHSAIAKALMEQLDLQYAGTAAVQGNYETQPLQTVRVANIKFGHSEFNNQTFAVADLDAISRAAGISVGGVLGNDVLKTVTFKLSYSRHIATFGPAAKLGNLGTPIRLREEGNQFFVPAKLLSVSRDLLLDTGPIRPISLGKRGNSYPRFGLRNR